VNPLVLIPFVLVIIAIVILVFAQRSSTMAPLVPWLVGAGIAGSLFVSMYVFINSTVPIAPYETGPGAWTPLIWDILLFAFAGFGLGVIVLSIFALPITYFRNRHKAG
jgi:hypothetical protein